jgi:hypothetical protein
VPVPVPPEAPVDPAPEVSVDPVPAPPVEVPLVPVPQPELLVPPVALPPVAPAPLVPVLVVPVVPEPVLMAPVAGSEPAALPRVSFIQPVENAAAVSAAAAIAAESLCEEVFIGSEVWRGCRPPADRNALRRHAVQVGPETVVEVPTLHPEHRTGRTTPGVFAFSFHVPGKAVCCGSKRAARLAANGRGGSASPSRSTPRGGYPSLKRRRAPSRAEAITV